MHIREDLVFNKNTGALVGFVNLGETNSHLIDYERSLQQDTSLVIYFLPLSGRLFTDLNDVILR